MSRCIGFWRAPRCALLHAVLIDNLALGAHGAEVDVDGNIRVAPAQLFTDHMGATGQCVLSLEQIVQRIRVLHATRAQTPANSKQAQMVDLCHQIERFAALSNGTAIMCVGHGDIRDL
jgi:hypothetical protein